MLAKMESVYDREVFDRCIRTRFISRGEGQIAHAFVKINYSTAF
jgi:hypothetical protein